MNHIKQINSTHFGWYLMWAAFNPSKTHSLNSSTGIQATNEFNYRNHSSMYHYEIRSTRTRFGWYLMWTTYVQVGPGYPAPPARSRGHPEVANSPSFEASSRTECVKVEYFNQVRDRRPDERIFITSTSAVRVSMSLSLASSPITTLVPSFTKSLSFNVGSSLSFSFSDASLSTVEPFKSYFLHAPAIELSREKCLAESNQINRIKSRNIPVQWQTVAKYISGND